MSKKTNRKSAAAAPDAARAGDTTQGHVADQEFELKLEIDAADSERLMAAAPFIHPDAVDRDQHSVYFDTPEQSLREAGLSLRVRTSGDRRIQTLKAEGVAAGGLFVRPEWEQEIESAEPVLDQLDEAIGHVLDEDSLSRLAPSFSVDVTRRTILVDRDGTSIEAVLDRGQIQSGRLVDPVCEVELELKRGDPAALFVLAREIDQTAPTRLGVLSKSERGYRLGTVEPDRPVKTAPLDLPAGLTTAQGFQAIVGACIRQFRLNEAIFRRNSDASALHQARVSLRRLRSALSTFKPMVEDERYDDIRQELRWIATELGQARNLDVLLERVSRKREAKPLRTARASAYEAVHLALASSRLRTLMLDLSELVAIGPWLSDRANEHVHAQSIETFAASALRKHRRRVKRLGRNLEQIDDEERHDARIEAKKLRYATEFFASLFPDNKSSRRHRLFYKALEELQAHLGDLNDLATAPVVLAELDLLDTPTAAALEPDLSQRKPLLAQAADAYDTLMDSKRFW